MLRSGGEWPGNDRIFIVQQDNGQGMVKMHKSGRQWSEKSQKGLDQEDNGQRRVKRV